MKNYVYLLQHLRPEDDVYEEDRKIMGVYSSEEEANKAIERFSKWPGFRDHPDQFTISIYLLDQDHWEGGFFMDED